MSNMAVCIHYNGLDISKKESNMWKYCIAVMVLSCFGHHIGEDDNTSLARNKAKYLSHIPRHDKPVMIWWTSHIFPHSQDHQNHEIQCNKGSCITSIDKSLKDDAATKMFIFYGTSLRANELPLPRRSWHEWALFHEESPKNNWMLTFEDALR
ncbi:alpha-(1,3)-fucosyltransferase 11 isoform X2 [Exaiptasia diaphana]|uniref:Uncharacterized protein n=1 Tax=Exaiptasia diaphana TaxID=2652724 RepID=A0A913XDF0_EXADI|nr:alpha-(1,3)-fucosyltransferase 11 isoform X2 [Exaiptasia diaphana]